MCVYFIILLFRLYPFCLTNIEESLGALFFLFMIFQFSSIHLLVCSYYTFCCKNSVFLLCLFFFLSNVYVLLCVLIFIANYQMWWASIWLSFISFYLIPLIALANWKKIINYIYFSYLFNLFRLHWKIRIIDLLLFFHP